MYRAYTSGPVTFPPQLTDRFDAGETFRSGSHAFICEDGTWTWMNLHTGETRPVQMVPRQPRTWGVMGDGGEFIAYDPRVRDLFKNKTSFRYKSWHIDPTCGVQTNVHTGRQRPTGWQVTAVPQSKSAIKLTPHDAGAGENDPIFCVPMSPPTQLSCCGHVGDLTSCQDYINQCGKCPACNEPLGCGAQPRMWATWTTIRNVIQLAFEAPAGVQGAHQPNPGAPYPGRRFVAVYPNTAEGKKAARMILRVFNARHLFRLATSAGSPDTEWPTFGSVHLKTRTPGHTWQECPSWYQNLVSEIAAVYPAALL